MYTHAHIYVYRRTARTVILILPPKWTLQTKMDVANLKLLTHICIQMDCTNSDVLMPHTTGKGHAYHRHKHEVRCVCVREKERDREYVCVSDTPLIDHLVMREFVSGDLTGGSPSTSVTVYTKHVHVMFNQQTVSSLQTLGIKENKLPKNCGFSKNSVPNPQTAHEPFLRLGFLSQTLSYMKR